jgi:hypothetical protein
MLPSPKSGSYRFYGKKLYLIKEEKLICGNQKIREKG